MPLVTCPGELPISRVGASLLRAIGLKELIARDSDDFVKICSSLAANREGLAELRASMRDRMQSSLLMNEPEFAQNVETAYRTAWRSSCDRS